MRIFIFALIVLTSVGASAQLDPSSALLLNSGSTSSQESGVETGRYTVRPRLETAPRREEPKPIVKKAPAEPVHEPDQVVYEPVLMPKSTPVTVPKTETNSPGADMTMQMAPAPSRHFNLLEVGIAPGYVYNGSSSSYSYRSYSIASPTIAADARVWLNHAFALQASYTSTLSASVNDSGARQVPVTQQWFTAGIRTRKFFTGGSVLSFGADYSEHQFRVSSDANARAKLKSSGLSLSLETELPATPTRAWTFGFAFTPKIQHSETSGATDFSSGANVDANSIGVSVGGRVQFARTDTIFWKISQTVEKYLYSGAASIADPVSGETPSGVGITNSFSQIQFGYTWGN